MKRGHQWNLQSVLPRSAPRDLSISWGRAGRGGACFFCWLNLQDFHSSAHRQANKLFLVNSHKNGLYLDYCSRLKVCGKKNEIHILKHEIERTKSHSCLQSPNRIFCGHWIETHIHSCVNSRLDPDLSNKHGWKSLSSRFQASTSSRLVLLPHWHQYYCFLYCSLFYCTSCTNINTIVVFIVHFIVYKIQGSTQISPMKMA